MRNLRIDRLEEEKHFSELKTLIVEEVIKIKQISRENIAAAIKEIIKLYDQKLFSLIDFSDWNYQCAYLFRYGVHAANLTRYRTLEAFQNCKDFVSLFQMPVLNIVNIGSGPGLDIVGLMSAMYENQIKSNLNITFIDSVSEWSLCNKLVNLFIREGQYGKASKYIQENIVTVKEIYATLPVSNPETNEEYFQSLRNVDIILMTKFMSSVDWAYKDSVVKEIHREMKNEAFLLLIDIGFNPKKDLWIDFEIVYISEVGMEYKYRPLFTVEGFGSNDEISSDARVVIFRKIQKN